MTNVILQHLNIIAYGELIIILYLLRLLFLKRNTKRVTHPKEITSKNLEVPCKKPEQIKDQFLGECVIFCFIWLVSIIVFYFKFSIVVIFGSLSSALFVIGTSFWKIAFDPKNHKEMPGFGRGFLAFFCMSSTLIIAYTLNIWICIFSMLLTLMAYNAQRCYYKVKYFNSHKNKIK